MGDYAAIAAELISQPGFDPSRLDYDRLAASLDDATVEELFRQQVTDAAKWKVGKYNLFFPDETVIPDAKDVPIFYARHLYPKHMEFFRAGAEFLERLFQAANRVGKTVCGAYEVTAHTTGQYKDWWEGKRFNHPTHGWAAGDTNETTRDIIQKELFGEVIWENGKKTFDGTGMIPKECIGPASWKRGVDNLADVVKVKHITGGWSTIGLKSYEQGRKIFQGTAKHWIWFDEEPPQDVYGEALIRLFTTRGIMLITFTPLSGMTEVVLSFMPDMDAAPTSPIKEV